MPAAFLGCGSVGYAAIILPQQWDSRAQTQWLGSGGLTVRLRNGELYRDVDVVLPVQSWLKSLIAQAEIFDCSIRFSWCASLQQRCYCLQSSAVKTNVDLVVSFACRCRAISCQIIRKSQLLVNTTRLLLAKTSGLHSS